uniref:ARAD1A00638p n=1 Tax=Blastobotrys adeninivorans TaxID=409370 RepID=A0A060T1H7_BLAAD
MTDVDALSKVFEKSLSLKDQSDANATLVDSFPQVELNDQQKAELHQWLTLSTRFNESEVVTQLNDTLRGRTYLLDSAEATVVDAVALSRIIAIVKSWNKEQIVANRHIVRWADLVQNVANVPSDKRIEVNVDLEAPREQKKKEKKDAKDSKDSKDAKGAKEGKEGDKKEKGDKPRGKPSPEEIAKAQKEKAEKKEKKKKAQNQAQAQQAPITPGMVDLRVGHIERAVKHPDADSLYVSTIHCGDDEPRTVCSGLVKYVPLEDMQGRDVVVVANLKPVTMRGIKSQAMVLCASDEEHGKVEFVNPPPGSKAGDKIFFESYDIDPEPVLNPKKKIWETVQPGFTTNDTLEVVFRKEGEPDRKLVNKKGEVCVASTLVGATVR